MKTHSNSAFLFSAVFAFSACGVGYNARGTGGGSGGFTGTGGSGGGFSSGTTCSGSSSCQAFACQCNDGMIWNSARYCLNGRCQNDSSTCGNACRDNGGGRPYGSTGTGGGTGAGGGTAMGGSSSSGFCTRALDCRAYSCVCRDGQEWDTARYCLNNVCQGEASTCADACKDHGGDS